MSRTSARLDGSTPGAPVRESAAFTAFDGFRRVASGPLSEVAATVRAYLRDPSAADGGAVLVFSDRDGRVVDLDLRGSEADVRGRAERRAAAMGPALGPRATDGSSDGGGAVKRGPGRPRLGVVGKEVTLLPRHWAWLDAQKGGASATLRRLVDAARRHSEGSDRVRAARDAAYRFMAAVAGDLPGYEESIRALFRGDRGRFDDETHDWPPDVRAYCASLAADALTDSPGEDEVPGVGGRGA